MKMSEFVKQTKLDDCTCIEDYSIIHSKAVFFCPVCKNELHYNGMESIETMNEHISNPNGTPSKKFVFKCADRYCPAKLLNIGWGSDGDLYFFGEYFSSEFLKGENPDLSAIGSFSHIHSLERVFRKNHTHKLKLSKRISIELFIVKNPLKWEFSLAIGSSYKFYERSIERIWKSFWNKRKKLLTNRSF